MKTYNRRLSLSLAFALIAFGIAFTPLQAALTHVATVSVSIDSTLTDVGDLSNAQNHLQQKYDLSLASGTGNGQSNNIFIDQRTLAASGTEDIDLAGVLTNKFGQTITFTKVKTIIVHAAVGNTNNVVISRPASNGLVLFSAGSDALPIQPNGTFMISAPNAGITVTASTGDLLTVTNSGGTTGVTYDLVIAGVS